MADSNKEPHLSNCEQTPEQFWTDLTASSGVYFIRPTGGNAHKSFSVMAGKPKGCQLFNIEEETKMRNSKVRIFTLPRLRAPLAVMVLVAVLLLAAPFHAALAQTAPDLTSFAVLGGPAVTLTGSTVNGDVGSLGAFTNTGSTVNGTVHQGDQVAIDAYSAFVGAYNALALVPCNFNLTGQSLPGQTLTPGVYCFDGAVAETGGTLTLDGQGNPDAVWIFKIGTSGTGALTGTGFSVEMSNGGDPCNVYWWVAEAATLTTSNFKGTILAGAAITISYGTFNGNALAKAAVTLSYTTVGCSPWIVPVTPIPIQLGSIKVTGGGQISVPNGQATFGFNAQPDKKGGGAKGHFNYVNHATGLHINGTVDKIMVIDFNPDNSPKTVLFSGTYQGGSFIVTVQDINEPGKYDQFGIWVSAVTGSQSEVRSMRVISNGNIQFHK